MLMEDIEATIAKTLLAVSLPQYPWPPVSFDPVENNLMPATPTKRKRTSKEKRGTALAAKIKELRKPKDNA